MVNSLLFMLDLGHIMDRSLPHSNTLCIIRYDPEETPHKDQSMGAKDERGEQTSDGGEVAALTGPRPGWTGPRTKRQMGTNQPRTTKNSSQLSPRLGAISSPRPGPTELGTEQRQLSAISSL
jgi:hypothetical protein